MSMEASDFVSAMLERTKIIIRMNRCKFPLEFLKEFGLTQMAACCDRIEASAVRETDSNIVVQKELVQNPAFAAYLAELTPFIPEEKLPEPAPTPVYARYGYGRRSYVRPPEPASSKRSEFMHSFWGLLTACQNAGEDITAYPISELVDILTFHVMDDTIRLIFLKNYISLDLTEDQRKTVIMSLRHCIELPLELNDRQRTLLLEPFVENCRLFESAPFLEVSNLLDGTPALLDIMRMLNQYGIKDPLTIKNYTVLAQNTTEYHQLLRTIIGQMDTDAAESFLDYWKKGGCSLWELRRMERWAASHLEQNWDNLFSTYSSYINQLYGKRFKAIDLSEVACYQESILIYAIVNRKKRFIQLIDACAETFLALPHTSIIFQEAFYHEHFNLNELTERDLKDCVWMCWQRLPISWLSSGRRYTFSELRALYDIKKVYVTMYHALKAPRQDDRLKVFQQLRRRNVLWKDITAQEISSLAEALDQKPLYEWFYRDFGHIRNLTVKDAAQILAHWGDLQQLVPSMKTQADASIALRSLLFPRRFSNMDELKMHIVQVDSDWQSLSSVMDLSQEFLELNWENIENFLLNNGSSIAETYRKCLTREDGAAFLRVVKAELMGKLEELKYFEGDLQHELNIPVSKEIVELWKENLHIHKADLDAGEYDDFFSTMLLGVQPKATCLSYLDGAYKSCLLSSFDSNKKVLYVKLDGQVVGRAFLRLTKGRLSDSDTTSSDRVHHFTFVDLENTQEARQESLHEQLTLFLERPYICGVGPEVECRIEQLLVNLARQKAEALHTLLVLSTDYRKNCGESFVRTQFDIYISKSKGTDQYLDSLDGRATVSKENSYKTNTFLILN